MGALGLGVALGLATVMAVDFGEGFKREVMAQVPNPPATRRAAPPPMRSWRLLMPVGAGGTVTLPSPVRGTGEGV